MSKPMFLFADAEDFPKTGKVLTRDEEIARLEAKAANIRECVEAYFALGKRCQARLDLLEAEIRRLKS